MEVLRGALALLLGITAFVFPVSALLAFTTVFAAYAAVDGVLSVVAAVRGARQKEDRWWTYIVRGLIGIATTALFVIAPVGMTIGYALVTLIMLSAWAIVTGSLELFAAIRLRKVIAGEWLMALSGALSLALCFAIVVLLIIDPLATFPSAAWVIGTYAIVAGIVLIRLGLRLRHA